MKHLRKFESFRNIGYGSSNDDRIEDNIKDIFVEYQDSHDLDIEVGKGYLPVTVADLNDNVIEVTLFSQRGIKFTDIEQETAMLIDYMKSLTDKVRIYYDIDKGGLRYWRPLAGEMDLISDYYLSNSKTSFNTIKLYFVEDNSVKESFVWGASARQKALAEVTDIFIELKDSGVNYTVSTLNSNTLDITIFNMKRGDVIDLDLVRDCVEMTKDYLSELGSFTEFYRFGYVWEGVNTKISNQGNEVNYKSTKRDNIEYSSFPDDFIADVESKHSLVHRFEYVLEGIKIVFTLNEN